MHTFEQTPFIGPPLEAGPLPAIFYFALSAEESLTQDPYNQPAVHLKGQPIRIFSVDLPAHGKGLNPVHAIDAWAKEFAAGRDPFTPFFDQTAKQIESLIDREIACKDKIAFMGLSRGGFISGHIALRIPTVSAILGFAPLTDLRSSQEFQELQNHPAIAPLALENHAAALCHIPTRHYVGNLDTRIDTARTFSLVSSLAKAAADKKIRALPHELIISPSIGHKGHGTGPATFASGADYLSKTLGVTP